MYSFDSKPLLRFDTGRRTKPFSDLVIRFENLITFVQITLRMIWFIRTQVKSQRSNKKSWGFTVLDETKLTQTQNPTMN